MKLLIFSAFAVLLSVEATHYGKYDFPDNPQNLDCNSIHGEAIIQCEWTQIMADKFGTDGLDELGVKSWRGFAIDYKIENVPESVKTIRLSSFGEEIKDPKIRLYVKFQEHYNITVWSFNPAYASKTPVKALVWSSYDPKFEWPMIKHVTATQGGTDKLTVCWTGINPDYFPSGHQIKNFTIRVESLLNGTWTKAKDQEVTDATALTSTVGGLEADAYYAVSVNYGLDSAGPNIPWSEPAYTYIEASSPPKDYPKNLECEQELNEIKCQWMEMSNPSSNDPAIKGYILEVVPESDDKKVKNISSKSITGHVFAGFDVNMIIRYGIAAWNDAGTGPFSPAAYIAMEGAPDGYPMNVTLRYEETYAGRFLLITWVPPHRKSGVGRYTGYEIGLDMIRHKEFKYTDNGEINEYSWPVSEINKGLKGFWVISIQVRVVNIAGNGPFSDPVRIINPQNCPYICNQGWDLFKQENKCYRAFKTVNQSYDQVMEQCKKVGGILARPNSQAESNFMSKLASVSIPGHGIRINVNKMRNPEQSKTWWDEGGNPLKWTNWFSHTDGCKEGWVASSDGNCYLHMDHHEVAWDEAVAVCKQHDSELVTAPSKDDSDELGHYLKYHSKLYWLNAQSDPEDHMKWTWQDRSQNDVTWTHWNYREPMAGRPHMPTCLAIDPLWKYWSARDCNEVHPFVCKQPIRDCHDKIPCTKDLCDSSRYGLFGAEKCPSFCSMPNSRCDEGPLNGGNSENCAYMSAYVEKQVVKSESYGSSLRFQGLWYPDSCGADNTFKYAEGYICMKAATIDIVADPNILLAAGMGAGQQAYENIDPFDMELASGGPTDAVPMYQMTWIFAMATWMIINMV